MFRLAAWSLLFACAAQAQTPNPYAPPPGSAPAEPDPYRPRVGEATGPVRGTGGGVVEYRHNYESRPSYSLSTEPLRRPTYAPPVFGGYGFGGIGWGYPGYGRGLGNQYGNYLQGVASVTAATGQYYQDVQSARITRYQANNDALQYAKNVIQAERDYERGKTEAYKQDIAREKRERLDRARHDAPNNEIWSGATFNTLLKSILDSPSPTNGPNIPVEPRIINGLNFSDKTSRGNLSMAKDEGKIDWTEALLADAFNTTRNRFSETYAAALSAAKSGTPPKRAEMTSLRNDLKRLETLLGDEVGNMSPGDYTTSRRLLNQLKDGITGLSDPNIYKTAFASKSRLKTVGDVVAYCRDNGLEFAAATAPGDAQAYSTFYFQLRDYDRGVWTGGR